MRRDELAAEVRGSAEVSAGDAYEAAVQRATRTQEALILSEAQVTHWKRLYVQEAGRADAAESEAERLKREIDARDADRGPELPDGTD